jgi:hypothetical protein
MLKRLLFSSGGSDLILNPSVLAPRTDVNPDPKENPEGAAEVSSLSFSLPALKVDPMVNC